MQLTSILCSNMIPFAEFQCQHPSPQTSYVLMFDGKKVLKGGDVELLGFEEGQTLECIICIRNYKDMIHIKFNYS